MNDIHIHNSVYKNYNPIAVVISFNSDTEIFMKNNIIAIFKYK